MQIGAGLENWRRVPEAPRGRVPGLGATGTFPRGHLDQHDEGALQMAIAACPDPRGGVVRIEFGKPVAWLGLPPREARAFAALILEKVNELESGPKPELPS